MNPVTDQVPDMTTAVIPTTAQGAGLAALAYRPDTTAVEAPTISQTALDLALVQATLGHLAPEQLQDFRMVRARYSVLVTAWFNGASQAATNFHSTLITDDGTVAPALAGNLLWVVSGFLPELLPEIAYIKAGSAAGSTAGAVLGTVGTVSSSDSRAQATINTNWQERLNELVGKLETGGDQTTLGFIKRVGWDSFNKDTPTAQIDALLWPSLLTAAAPDGNYINAAATSVAATLNTIDSAAARLLQHYSDAWNASVDVRMVGPGGGRSVPRGTFRASRWLAYANGDNIEWYTLRPIVDGEDVSLTYGGDPLEPGLRNRRATQLLIVVMSRAVT